MAIVKGTSRNDALTSFGGFGETDFIYGLGGDDTLKGSFKAKNYIYGGDGDDRIEGGAMSNYFYGWRRSSITWSLFFTPNDDDTAALYGGSGADHLRAAGFDHDGEQLCSTEARAPIFSKAATVATSTSSNSARDRIVETYVPEFQNEIDPRDEVRASINWVLASRLEDLGPHRSERHRRRRQRQATTRSSATRATTGSRA